MTLENDKTCKFDRKSLDFDPKTLLKVCFLRHFLTILNRKVQAYTLGMAYASKIHTSI